MDERTISPIHPKGDFFNLKGNHTTVGTEAIAGITTFFAMAYIIMVNPSVLSQTGMPWGAVFLATIIASVIGTLIMGLFANVPYAQAPGMGLNAFFTYTVCFGLHFTWQEALAMVFICGLVNIIVTVTKLRRLIITSIPQSLRYAISGGIGIFIAYIGIKNAGLIQFAVDAGNYTSTDGKNAIADITKIGITANAGAVPELIKFNTPAVLLALVGIVLTFILLVRKVPGAILISIAAITVLGIPFGVTQIGGSNTISFGNAVSQLPSTFCAAFGPDGVQHLFSNASNLPLVLMTIFAFGMTDMFDTVGTLIGTGSKSGIFNIADENTLSKGKGFTTKMDRALFADAFATSAGAVIGTSNVTTFVESSAGIGAGGRTGLTSVFTSLLFIISAFAAPVVSAVPSCATAPALIAVGIMMLSSFKEIEWTELSEAIPAFFAGIFMALCYSISYGIAMSFITYCIIKVCKGKAKEVSPMLWVVTGLFILNFVVQAVL
ncbi:MAG: NCS2 family permease [Oscillospiraceae bacterium]|nr:NCS2 family permease [Oscillospiraceae bacterium]